MTLQPDVRATTLVSLAQAKSYLRLALATIVSGISAGGATLSGDVSGFKANLPVAVTVSGVAYLVNLQSIAGLAVTWTPNLPGVPVAGDTVSDATYDANLVLFLDQGSETIEEACGRFFQLRSAWTEQFTGRGGSTFWSQYYPIQNVSVAFDGVVQPSTQYVVNPMLGMVKFKNGYAFAGSGEVGDVVVTYDAGYDGTVYKLPANAVGLLLGMTKIQYDGWKTGGMSVNTLNIGGFGLTVVQDLPRNLLRMLDGLSDNARQMFMEGQRL